mmetsp:Transcript_10821/g.35551  ORF Transcript_10821/g.35551 Transcript_10821/m.35551 type:complete len:141 (+) Transcript_10821:961-1383(+)
MPAHPGLEQRVSLAEPRANDAELVYIAAVAFMKIYTDTVLAAAVSVMNGETPALTFRPTPAQPTQPQPPAATSTAPVAEGASSSPVASSPKRSRAGSEVDEMVRTNVIVRSDRVWREGAAGQRGRNGSDGGDLRWRQTSL